MRTIIAGSRSIKNYSTVAQAIRESGFSISEVVEGEAPGVDRLGKRWARKHNIPIKPFPAKWDDLSHPNARIKINRYGRKYDANAGHRRNREMAQYADALVAVWDGISPGTATMIQYAEEEGLEVFIYEVWDEETKGTKSRKARRA